MVKSKSSKLKARAVDEAEVKSKTDKRSNIDTNAMPKPESKSVTKSKPKPKPKPSLKSKSNFNTTLLALVLSVVLVIQYKFAPNLFTDIKEYINPSIPSRGMWEKHDNHLDSTINNSGTFINYEIADRVHEIDNRVLEIKKIDRAGAEACRIAPKSLDISQFANYSHNLMIKARNFRCPEVGGNCAQNTYSLMDDLTKFTDKLEAVNKHLDEIVKKWVECQNKNQQQN